MCNWDNEMTAGGRRAVAGRPVGRKAIAGKSGKEMAALGKKAIARRPVGRRAIAGKSGRKGRLWQEGSCRKADRQEVR